MMMTSWAIVVDVWYLPPMEMEKVFREFIGNLTWKTISRTKRRLNSQKEWSMKLLKREDLLNFYGTEIWKGTRLECWLITDAIATLNCSKNVFSHSNYIFSNSPFQVKSEWKVAAQQQFVRRIKGEREIWIRNAILAWNCRHRMPLKKRIGFREQSLIVEWNVYLFLKPAEMLFLHLNLWLFDRSI